MYIRVFVYGGRSVEISVWDGFNNTEMFLRGEKSQPIEDLRRILNEQQRVREENVLESKRRKKDLDMLTDRVGQLCVKL